MNVYGVRLTSWISLWCSFRCTRQWSLASYDTSYSNSKRTLSRFPCKSPRCSICVFVFVLLYVIRCPLYAKLYLRENATQFSSETIDQRSEWGSTNTCEFASFAYLSAFVLSFISLWIHVVFRRVLRTERLLRLPITISTFAFAIVVLVATAIGVDGVIKFCSRGQASICSSSGSVAFSKSRWKLISLPVGMNETFFEQSELSPIEERNSCCTRLGGTLTCFALLLNALARVIQLFAKPKKSPEALKLLLSVLMNSRQQEKRERDLSGPGSQASRSSFDRFDVPVSILLLVRRLVLSKPF